MSESIFREVFEIPSKDGNCFVGYFEAHIREIPSPIIYQGDIPAVLCCMRVCRENDSTVYNTVCLLNEVPHSPAGRIRAVIKRCDVFMEWAIGMGDRFEEVDG